MLWPNGSGVPQASHSSQNAPIPATVWNVLIAMCGRLPFGKRDLNVSAMLVGAAMCSTC
jgi:hypothetical protein